MELLLLLHVGATLALVGLIWIVQLAVYPLFAQIAKGPFAAYHAAWCDRITWIVAPLFALEGLGSVALVTTARSGFDPLLTWLGLGTVLANAASTAFIQVPLHARLARSFEPGIHARLVRSNWIRTGLWSLHGALVLALLRDWPG